MAQSSFEERLIESENLWPISSRQTILNPPPSDLAELGRVLFYDKKLSRNDSIACASCHQQQFAFSDTARFSRGLDGLTTRRNSMAAFNTAFHVGGFFWDLRASTLEEQVLMPIQDPSEMDMDLANLTQKLASSSYYPNLFERAFGDSQIYPERIASALAAFLRQIISNRSRYDDGIANQFADFTDQERLGFDLFTRFADPNASPRGANCFLCHSHVINFSNPTFAGFASNGLDSLPADSGVGAISGQSEHLGTFKIPTLRNIELTPPYMHDGRFSTLEEVIDHYDQGLKAHVNLDPILRDLGNVRPGFLDLTAEEKAALVAFMKTFTDTALINDPDYGDPFTTTNIINLTDNSLIESFHLGQNFPNPFNPQTTIPLRLQSLTRVNLTVLDILGREVVTLEDAVLNAGDYLFRWNGQNQDGQMVSSGIYFYQLQIGLDKGASVKRIKKMIFLK